MKVYVTQGHEKGIGLETFFKSCLFLDPSELAHIKLLAFRKTVSNTLKLINIPFKILEDHIEVAHIRLPVSWIENVSYSQSFTALELGMRLAESGGVLLTLPTSKDQFPGFAGHTEFFRYVYKKPELGMFFDAPKMKVLLVSDHIAVSKLSEILTEKRIYNSLVNALKTLTEWNYEFDQFIVAGFNPHAGEEGLIGNEDIRVKKAVEQIRKKFKFDILGPKAGDTLTLERRSVKDVLVYLFHDQGLPLFKGTQGFIGANITLGLPYPRYSPDHGTSFGLYGKNRADYRGTQYSLNQALLQLFRIRNGQNSSNKSKSS